MKERIAIVLLFLSRLLCVSCLSFIVRTKAPKPPPPSRRDVFEIAASLAMVGTTLLTTPLVSHADDNEQVSQERDRGGKPFAPLEALLPATRLKLWIDQAHVISSSLQTTNDKDTQHATLQQLNDILSNPPKLFLSSPKVSKSSGAMAQLSTSSVNKEQSPPKRSSFNIANEIAAMLNQADVQRQWGMLQYQESKLEQENEMRAALNYYTSRLEFGNSYLLTASEQDRKRMIRNEKLPTVTAVITSDLDVRELYRNTFLTTIEDARAEVAFQLEQQSAENVDTTDVIDLMNQAFTACEEWFHLIAPQDVQDAIEAVAKDSDRVAVPPVW